MCDGAYINNHPIFPFTYLETTKSVITKVHYYLDMKIRPTSESMLTMRCIALCAWWKSPHQECLKAVIIPKLHYVSFCTTDTRIRTGKNSTVHAVRSKAYVFTQVKCIHKSRNGDADRWWGHLVSPRKLSVRDLVDGSTDAGTDEINSDIRTVLLTEMPNLPFIFSPLSRVAIHRNTFKPGWISMLSYDYDHFTVFGWLDKIVSEMSSTGIQFFLNPGVFRMLMGDLAEVIADSPAVNFIGSFMEGVGFAAKPCRTYHLSSNELHVTVKQTISIRYPRTLQQRIEMVHLLNDPELVRQNGLKTWLWTTAVASLTSLGFM